MKPKREEETKLYTDKYIKLFLISFMMLIVFSACASHQDKGYYNRANKASEKALDKLDRE